MPLGAQTIREGHSRLRRSNQRRPQHTEAYTKRGSAWQALGNLENAIRDWDEAIKLSPRDPFLFSLRGEAWRMKPNLRAIDDLTEAIRLDPNQASFFSHRAMAFLDFGERRKAIDDCTEAIRIDPNLARAYAVRGRAWTELEQFEIAQADLDRAILLDPGDSVALRDRGAMHSQQKNDDKALADLSEAIRLNSKDAAAYCYRGYTWARKGDFGKALADYEASLSIEPDDVATRNLLGLTWTAANQLKKALAEFDRALQKDPDNLLVQFNRAVVLLLLRDGGAVTAFHSVISRDRWQTEFSFDSAVLGYFAALRSGQKDHAKAFLDDAAARHGEKARRPPIIGYLRRETDERKTLASALEEEMTYVALLSRPRRARERQV